MVADNHAKETSPVPGRRTFKQHWGEGGEVPVMEHIDANPKSASTIRLRPASTALLLMVLLLIVLQPNTMRRWIRRCP